MCQKRKKNSSAMSSPTPQKTLQPNRCWLFQPPSKWDGHPAPPFSALPQKLDGTLLNSSAPSTASHTTHLNTTCWIRLTPTCSPNSHSQLAPPLRRKPAFELAFSTCLRCLWMIMLGCCSQQIPTLCDITAEPSCTPSTSLSHRPHWRGPNLPEKAGAGGRRHLGNSQGNPGMDL